MSGNTKVINGEIREWNQAHGAWEKSYHTDYDSGDSHSSLELFRESPAKYAAIRVFRTMQPDIPSPATRIGSALHALCFEYDKECRWGMRQKRTKGQRLDLWNKNVTIESLKIELDEKDIRKVFGMLTAIFAEPDALNLLVEQLGFNERVVHIPHPETGLQLKCKPDRQLQNGLVVDLKTVDGAVDPLSWSRTLAKWGYHRQAAFYLDVLKLAGQKADGFIFVAVSKEPPHEIGMYLLDDASVEQGRRENRELLESLAECRRTGIWKHEWQGKILAAGVPRWALER